jgi:putative oxidoreductase
VARLERSGLPGHERRAALKDSPLLTHPVLQLALRLFLGGYFLYAAIPKILDPAAFGRVVYQWQVTPPVPSNVVAVVLPWVEGISGILLIAGIWKREAAATICMLLVVFLLAASSVMWRGIDVENCGCTSVAAHAEKSWTSGVGWFLVTRNLLMLAGALLLALVPSRGSVAEAPVGAVATGAGR